MQCILRFTTCYEISYFMILCSSMYVQISLLGNIKDIQYHYTMIKKFKFYVHVNSLDRNSLSANISFGAYFWTYI